MNRNDLFEALGLAGENNTKRLARRRLRAMGVMDNTIFTFVVSATHLLRRWNTIKESYVIGHKDGHG
ncbi:hypothetical protein O9929_01280 [Vibrio lentus]|nr:hypothetical protein [Vibrio lentus]